MLINFMRFYPFLSYPIELMSYEDIKDNCTLVDTSKQPTCPPKPKAVEGAWEFIFGIRKSRMDAYYQEKENFSKNLLKYKEECKSCAQTNIFLIKHAYLKNPDIVQNKYFELFSTASKLLTTDYNNKKGVSEYSFKKILKNKYGEQVKTDLCFNEIDGFPDFLLYKSINNINYVINIEIDEPYVAETGESIHFLTKHTSEPIYSYEYTNQSRDTRFNNYGIIVVRFAEEQVVKYPKECIVYLEDIISSIKNNTFPYRQIKTKNLPMIKRWTKDESIKMSNNNYRNTYLKETKITTAVERGYVYQIKDLYGTWFEDGFIMEFKPEYNSLKDYSYVSFSEYNIKTRESISGPVSVKNNLITIKIYTIGVRSYVSKVFELKILNCSNDELQYERISDGEIFIAKKSKTKN